MTTYSRRHVIGAGLGLAAASFVPARAGNVFRVGYQPYGNLIVLKSLGTLEAALRPLGWDVTWRRFVSGPPLLEALAAGALDFGTTGETPPIFAQASGAPIVYQAAEAPAPRGEAVIVKTDSSIRSLAELKGKKIGVTRGSNAHYLYVQALKKGGLSLSDVTTIYLAPPDGRAAFERGAIDAWSVWDPFLAAVQATGQTRVLTNGEGLVTNTQYYLSARSFKDQSVLSAMLSAIRDTDKKVSSKPEAFAGVISREISIPEEVIQTALKRQAWGIRPIDDALVAQQQKIADEFFALGLIPKAIRVSEAVSQPS